MSKVLSVSGSMYEANIVDLTEKETQKILSALESGDEPFEGLEDLEDRLNDDSVINGFVVSDGIAQLDVDVDGQPVDVDLKVEEDSSFSEPVTGEPAQLVIEKYSSRGLLTLELDDDEDFDTDKFKLVEDYLTLPTGRTQTVVNPSYGYGDFEFEDSWTQSESIYIVLANGQTVVLTGDQ